MSNSKNETLISLSPILVLMVTLAGAIHLFKDSATSGPAQVALMLAGLVAGAVGLHRGIDWRTLEKGVAKTVSGVMPAIFILLMVGVLIGLWLQAGVIPAMVYWGMKILSPSIFYLAVVLITSIVALAIGSAWTTMATLGIAFISIASVSGLSIEMTAGAVVSGAYFGDKMSPLSDTTNMASGVTSTDLFEHIRFLTYTTAPAILFAFILFGILSLFATGDIDTAQINEINGVLEANFNLSLVFFLPLVITLVLAGFRVPAILSIFLGGVSGAVIGLLFQPGAYGSGVIEAISSIWQAAANGYVGETGNAALDNLLTRGGMESMMNTIWLVLSAMFFGGMMEVSGSLHAIVRLMLMGVHTGGKLMQRAGLTAIGANIIMPDQYLSIVVPSRMYADKFEEMGLESKNLSRVLEDYGTVTSPLVPWNTCGAYVAGTLGVATLAYLPFCFFNLASPLISYIYSAINYKVEYKQDEAAEGAEDMALGDTPAE